VKIAVAKKKKTSRISNSRARNDSFSLDDGPGPLPLLPLHESVSAFKVPSQRVLLLDLVNPDKPILRRERLLEVVQSWTGGGQLLVADAINGGVASEKLVEPM